MAHLQLLLLFGLFMHLGGINVDYFEYHFAPDSDNPNFRHLAFNTGVIYIGGLNKLYKLSQENLTLLQEANTCHNRNCSARDNYNQLLLVSRDGVITCGTGQLTLGTHRGDGTKGGCVLRNKENISSVLETGQGSLGEVLEVSDNPNRPAVGFITATAAGALLYNGVTFSENIPKYNPLSAVDPARTTNFLQVKSQEESILKMELKDKSLNNAYLIYFRYAFEHNHFSYFLTNQKSKVGAAEPYVTKLIRVCQNGTAFRTYTDIQLQCTQGNYKFNILQGAKVFEPGTRLRDVLSLSPGKKVLAASFATGNPEQPQGPSAVCIYTLNELDQKILEAKRKFIMCPVSGVLNDTNRYFQRYRKDCSNQSFTDSNLHCENWNWYYIIGEVNLTKTALKTFDDKLYLTKVDSRIVYQDYTEIYVGTSTGWVRRLNINSDEPDSAVEAAPIPVDPGNPITAIDHAPGSADIYVMSSNKIVKLKDTDCSRYYTCAHLQKSNDPICGWCVYRGRSTRKSVDECPSVGHTHHWLSALDECITVTAGNAGAPVGGTQTIVNIYPFPARLRDDKYTCGFYSGSTLIEEDNAASVKDGTFVCDLPTVQVHTEATMQFSVVIGGNATALGSTSFLFYNCSTYKSCLPCTSDSRSDCSWCLSSNGGQCVDSSDCTNPGAYNLALEDDCPVLVNNSEIHIGVESNEIQSVLVYGKNFYESDKDGTKMAYSCSFDYILLGYAAAGIGLIASWIDDTTINCIFIVSKNRLEYVAQEMTVTPLLVTIDGTLVDDPYHNNVTLYHCGRLGQDCSICNSFQAKLPVKYNCGWCKDACVFGNKCNDSCPAPQVRKISPSDGILEGGTKVTLQGQNMGSVVSDVTDVTLAGIPCVNISEFQPSKEFKCVSGNVSTSTTGPVMVEIKGVASTSHANFSYEDPVLKAIYPNLGPKSGNTRVTITGDYLGLGNQDIHVLASNGTHTKICKDAAIWPKSRFINSSIVCKTPMADSKEEVISGIFVTFDGTGTRHMTVNYNYMPDPEVNDIFPKRSIQSGGIGITFSGQNLDYILTPEIYLNDTRVQENISGECEIKTNSFGVCQSPALPPDIDLDVTDSNSKTDQSCNTCFDVALYLDGVTFALVIDYTIDPTITTFGNNTTRRVEPGSVLSIQGKNMNLAASKADVSVAVGNGFCDVTELNSNNITCKLPSQQPQPRQPNETVPGVNVSIGNYYILVGYIQYDIELSSANVQTVLIGVIAAVTTITLIVIVIGVIYFKRRNQNLKKKTETLQEHLHELEEMKSKEKQDSDVLMKRMKELEEKLENTKGGNDYLLAIPGSNQSASNAGYLEMDHASHIQVNDAMLEILMGENLLIEASCLTLGLEVGQGNFGRVYKGYYIKDGTQRDVALKTLHINNPRPIDVENFLGEALIMKEFHHENVMELVGICLDMDAMPIVVLPYLPNGNVLSYLRDNEKVITVKSLMSYAIDIATGMTYLSSLKFVHRDLAARNCMFDENYRVKVADFGLSRDIYEKEYYASDNKKAKLPVKWMAPESLDKGLYTEKSDVWSYGVVLWELLTRGLNPYPGVDNWDMFRYLKSGRRMLRPEFCPNCMYEVICSCWQFDPDKRPCFSEIQAMVENGMLDMEVELEHKLDLLNPEHPYVNETKVCGYSN